MAANAPPFVCSKLKLSLQTFQACGTIETTPGKEKLTVDRVLKELFQNDRPILFDNQRRADLMARLDNGSLFNTDFQPQNDIGIFYRVGI